MRYFKKKVGLSTGSCETYGEKQTVGQCPMISVRGD